MHTFSYGGLLAGGLTAGETLLVSGATGNLGSSAVAVVLAMSLHVGLALGVAYGIWAASGVALTAVASRILFNETLTKVMSLGIALIVAGVLTIELGAAH
ncbi:SMR family transporter [Streptomyces kronopolitis]|uniref:SMR family transporter n=1 Tax=Streptomyces kronopolitis TaxID=1612435 RepID=UPI00369198E6